ncbi:sigma-70 family RNA polymerase sigma factor [Paraburkholderia caribensis]|uniref:sigma-70 family RNA polymerase sigma factor n=1 Tax=Paraburkholderia caribensis TaxID=75105 RepID=UPI001CB4DAEC|nr:sigma-70 family RNA polymerase sigma factor [Paraburkholderia caribensis]CAG9242827.1 ECF RNA polymerase sigma factor SigF [Paraburkholderia caribensis]
MERINVRATLQHVEIRLRSLFILAQDGDGSAYRTFLSETANLLRGFLRRRLLSQPNDIEDIVQEVLLAVHNARATWRSDEPLTAWIHAIARYKLADYFRSRARRESLNDPLDDVPEMFAEPETERSEARRDLMLLLNDLPDKQRLPILHVKVEGLSVAETAHKTGLSESAVKVGIHRGLKALAAKIRGG